MRRTLMILSACVVLMSFNKKDDTDPDGGWLDRSGLSLYIDSRTGCNYIKAGVFGGLTPRLDKEGRQICREAMR